MDPNRHLGDPGLRVDPLVLEINGQTDTYVGVSITCPTAPTLLEGRPFRLG